MKGSVAQMRVTGIAGWSGAGKTTLIEKLIPLLREAGYWVATVKHAHCGFDLDVQGKDSWRHRRAGACEVVVASDERIAVIRERPAAPERRLHDLLLELDPPADETPSWVLVEGFKQAPIPKIEVWRAALGQPPCCLGSRTLMAIATPGQHLPGAHEELGHLPKLDLNNPRSIVAYLLSTASRYEYSFSANSRSEIGVGPGAVPMLGPIDHESN